MIQPSIPDGIDGAFIGFDEHPNGMCPATYTCVCGATLRYKQDLLEEPGTVRTTWKCRDCETPVPGKIGEKLRHQHPS